MTTTGEVVEVTPNVAFGLIDSGKAIKTNDPVGTRPYPDTPRQRETVLPPLARTEDEVSVDASRPTYPTRQMRAGETAQVSQPKAKRKRKGYKTK